jgi:hypothetical protein
MARPSQSLFAKLSIAVANIGCESLPVTHICIFITFYFVLLSHLFDGTM